MLFKYKDLLRILFWATFTLLYSRASTQHSKIFYILRISEDFSAVLKNQVTERMHKSPVCTDANSGWRMWSIEK